MSEQRGSLGEVDPQWLGVPSLLGAAEALGTRPAGLFCCLGAALSFCTQNHARSGGGAARAAPSCEIPAISPSFSPCEARWHRGERGRTCRGALASPATSDRGIERRRGRALCPSQRAASSPFVYHTSCLLFCLLHTSSPSLIVLPAPPFGPLDFRLAMGNSNYLRH